MRAMTTRRGIWPIEADAHRATRNDATPEVVIPTGLRCHQSSSDGGADSPTRRRPVADGEPNSARATRHGHYCPPVISVRTATVNRLYRFVSGSKYQALRDGLGIPSARSELTSGR